MRAVETFIVLIKLGVAVSTHIFAAVSDDAVATVGASCGQPESIGLINATSGEWVESSCMAAAWAGSALTSTMLPDASVIVYVMPGGGMDSFLAHVDFATRRIKTAIVGGLMGDLRCISKAADDQVRCFGVVPGDADSPTQLVGLNATGDLTSSLTLKSYLGYSIDSSAVDPVQKLFHAVLVGQPHRPSTDGLRAPRSMIHAPPSIDGRLARTPKHDCGGGCPRDDVAIPADKSDQYLVTIDLERMAIIAEVPVSRNLMGPFSVSAAHGLATFGSDAADGLVAIDFRTGEQTLLVSGGGSFGTIIQYSGAFSSADAYAVNVYPQPTHFFAISLPARGSGTPPSVTTNATFRSSIHALSAKW